VIASGIVEAVVGAIWLVELRMELIDRCEHSC